MDRTQIGAYQRWGEGANGERWLNGYGVSFWGVDNVGVREGLHWYHKQ